MSMTVLFTIIKQYGMKASNKLCHVHAVEINLQWHGWILTYLLKKQSVEDTISTVILDISSIYLSRFIKEHTSKLYYLLNINYALMLCILGCLY